MIIFFFSLRIQPFFHVPNQKLFFYRTIVLAGIWFIRSNGIRVYFDRVNVIESGGQGVFVLILLTIVLIFILFVVFYVEQEILEL